MKKLIGCLWILLLIACSGEPLGNCFSGQGETITKEYTAPFFNKVRIEDDVALVIEQDSVQQLVIEAGERIQSSISAEVLEGVLVIKNGNRCNLLRDYGGVTAYVRTPDIEEIRNSSEFDVRSIGVLNVPFLRLVSNTTGGIEDSRKSGDFFLSVECQDLRVEANGFSKFVIDGFSEEAQFTFEDEIPRLEARNLRVNHVRIFQRSANLMIVHPLESLEGKILGTGDVISVNRPPIVNVESLFTGQLLFED